MHRDTSTQRKLLGLFRSASDLNDLQTVLVRSFLLHVLMQYFDTVSSFYSFLKTLYLKAIAFSKCKGYFNGKHDLKGLRHTTGNLSLAPVEDIKKEN